MTADMCVFLVHDSFIISFDKTEAYEKQTGKNWARASQHWLRAFAFASHWGGWNRGAEALFACMSGPLSVAGSAGARKVAVCASVHL
jgi:hypothetical protein